MAKTKESLFVIKFFNYRTLFCIPLFSCQAKRDPENNYGTGWIMAASYLSNMIKSIAE